MRFTYNDGDLGTLEGVQKLWLWIYMYEPRHIWLAPECRLWGKFSNLNMSKSHELCSKIVRERLHNKHHLRLCNEVYLYQSCKRRHAHLEQPSESSMMSQEELSDFRGGSLQSTFDMCRVGKLRLPRKGDFLRKRTSVNTTSGYVDFHLHQKYCKHDHAHEVIQVSMKHEGRRINVSEYASPYTSTFGAFVAEKILEECRIREPPVVLFENPHDVFAVDQKHESPDLAPEDSQSQKRRRYGIKGPPRGPDAESAGSPPRAGYGKSPTWEGVIKGLSSALPRVGNLVLKGDDPQCADFHALVPELQVKLVLLCRGTERYRVPGNLAGPNEMPWRKTVIVDRTSGRVVDLGPPENWWCLSRIKQTRKAGPARISVTVFGTKAEPSVGSPHQLPADETSELGVPLVPDVNKSPDTEVACNKGDSQSKEDQPGPLVSVPSLEGDQQMMHRDREISMRDVGESGEIEGWAPRIIPRSGPAFELLDVHQKNDLKRLHANLGHPSPEKLCRLLSEQGADQRVVCAARDYQCDVCVENHRGPKLANPSTIHEHRDFNDVVGCDGAYWKGSMGVTYHFLHFIDESTLFHLGALSGRTVDEQISTFENVWLQWAGPCKTLYLDPAGEYVNTKWHTHLQQENIKVSMSAGDSHWQLGRTEAHGKIIKQMLTAMDVEEPIESVDEFKRCLRQAFAAKNSMGQTRGFSPEQALLGKARSLPGSLMADEQTAAHALLDADTPDGLRFREDLARRERARRAFLSADNDQAIRRALLRRPRIAMNHFQKGDWVLYWRKHKGNMKGDRGRWYGPGQIVVCENQKVVWISHSGYLIRASPQQIRPASMREFRAISRSLGGNVHEIRVDPKCKNFVDLGSDEPPVESIEPDVSESTDAVPNAPVSVASSQPDGEVFPPEGFSNGSYTPTSIVPTEGDEIMPEVNEAPEEEREKEAHEIPVPDDGQDLLFGDDVSCEPGDPGFWEIGFENGPKIDVDGSSDVSFCDVPEVGEWLLLATDSRKQKVEIQWKNLTDADRVKFQNAKDKEIKAWVSHKTVCRLAKGTLRDDQIMRCRWIFTWKPPAPGTTEERAKACLVIRGFEDPELSSIAADAPTLSKDGKQLILQQVASRGWRLINFDISTAFLKGAGDGRKLGIHAPPELKRAIGLQNDEQCGLLGGAYGRADALLLWYKTLRETMEGLGFVVSPFDGCVFTLVTKGHNGKPKVHGCVGLHVDDGIGGGDKYFREIIGKLRSKFEFGAYNEGDFEFCGVRYYQWDDGSIEMSQDSYVQKIHPIEIPRSRRQQSQSSLTPLETQQLRQICGSLQYAAVHTRPDLSAKVGELQSAVASGKVEHLINANRVLYEAKANPVSLMIVPIPEHAVTFCAFSDASFETGKGRSTRQGTLIFSTDGKLEDNVKTVVCPVAWSSKKIPRVVRSTLSAEAIALGSTLDRLSWIRVFWEWMKNPAVDWSNPSDILREAPRSVVVTDCKSVYDLSTKTSTPACSESRTTLECLLIRERLQENCRLRWVNSKAMLADCLTKSMDGQVLRQALLVGRYTLFDEKTVLQQRANKRAQLKWINEGTEHDAVDMEETK